MRGSKEYLAEETPHFLKGTGVQENLGGFLNLDLEFTDHQGKPKKLQTYFDGNKPVLMTVVYYRCPSLCNFHLNGLFEALTQVRKKPGEDYELLVVSMDFEETSDLARKKRENYLKKLRIFGERNFFSGRKF